MINRLNTRNQVKKILSLSTGLAYLCLFLACSEGPQNFIEFLYFLGDQKEEFRQDIFADWVKSQNTFPVVENDKVYFIYQNEKDLPFYLCGDFNNWVKDSTQFLRIIGTDFYYTEERIPQDARIEYSFNINGRFITDPLNSKIKETDKGQVSVLMMPAYEYPVEVLLNRFQPYTVLDTLLIKSNLFPQEINIFLYKHPQAKSESPLLVFNEGEKYLDNAHANIILDNLIDLGKIPPCYSAFVGSMKNTDNQVNADMYFKIVFTELLPSVQIKLNLDNLPSIVFGGSNLNRQFSLKALKEYGSEIKSIFSQVIPPDSLGEQIFSDMEDSDLSTYKIFMECSIYTTPDSVVKQWGNFLSAKNANFRISVVNEGENWENYAGHLDDALIFLLNKNQSH